MPIAVSYMGTKRQLADLVAEKAESLADGPFLDLFAGVCSVSRQVGTRRPVWCNDIQLFSHTVASAFFCASEVPAFNFSILGKAANHYEANRIALQNRFGSWLEMERAALASAKVTCIRQAEERLPYFEGSSPLKTARGNLARHPSRKPYRLLTMTYAGTYLGLAQCIEVDSVRFAVDRLREEGELSSEGHRWACLALCEAISRCAMTTGHFAQFLSIKTSNKYRYIALRRRSIWREWLRSLQSFAPIGNSKWRSQNRAFNRDAISMVKSIQRMKRRPAVIYADPPYTDDQYSRFYHLYETVLLYDYPVTSSKARYRNNRATSAFSIKTEVRRSFENLIGNTAETGAGIIISYPSNGLLEDSSGTIQDLLAAHYKNVKPVKKISHFHSTMGGSKGSERNAVVECLFSAAHQ